MSTNPETVLMHKIMSALSSEGNFVLRTNSGVYFDHRGNRVTIGFSGLSDLVGCTPDGRFYAIEIKTPNYQPRPEQQQFLNIMRKRGALAGCAHSVEEALEIVNGT